MDFRYFCKILQYFRQSLQKALFKNKWKCHYHQDNLLK